MNVGHSCACRFNRPDLSSRYFALVVATRMTAFRHPVNVRSWRTVGQDVASWTSSYGADTPVGRAAVQMKTKLRCSAHVIPSIRSPTRQAEV